MKLGTIVMLRKCMFVILTVFLRSYGPSPKLSRRYGTNSGNLCTFTASSIPRSSSQLARELWPARNMIQLLVTLIGNMIGRIRDKASPSQWSIGPIYSCDYISCVLQHCIFLWTTFVWTTRRSHRTKGAVGILARCCHDCSQKCCRLGPLYNEPHGIGDASNATVAPTIILPSSREHVQESARNRLNARLVMASLDRQRNQDEVKNIETEVQKTRLRKVRSIKRRGTERSARLKSRLDARNKVKHNKVLQKCRPFANLTSTSISSIVNAMNMKIAKGGDVICRKGELANHFFVIVEGTCVVTVGKLSPCCQSYLCLANRPVRRRDKKRNCNRR